MPLSWAGHLDKPDDFTLGGGALSSQARRKQELGAQASISRSLLPMLTSGRPEISFSSQRRGDYFLTHRYTYPSRRILALAWPLEDPDPF